MSSPIAPLGAYRSKRFVDPASPAHVYEAVELEGDSESGTVIVGERTEEESPGARGLGGVFVLLPIEEADRDADVEETEVGVSPQTTAIKALLDFSHATATARVDAASILEAATRSLLQFAGESRLPEAEAEFLNEHGDVSPASTIGLVQLRAEQAARDASGFIDTEEVAALLKIDASRVRHRKGAGGLISHKFGKDLRYPTWQFTMEGGVLPRLAELNEALDPSIHPADVAAIMTTPQADLVVHGHPVAPTEWLASGGDVRAVLDLLSDDVAW